jgi:hypothetical protein
MNLPRTRNFAHDEAERPGAMVVAPLILTGFALMARFA